MSLDWGSRTFVMGIINVTPDSFSGDGLISNGEFLAHALNQAEYYIAEGVDILDVGGESTRPGSSPISLEEELARVIPVIKAIRGHFDIAVSVDTYRSAVAEAALDAGADWINDVWGLRMDKQMAYLAASRRCPIIIMHNRSKPKNVAQEKKLGGRYIGVHYDHLIEDVKRELLESVDMALSAGVDREQIILDPGIGFGKTVSQNLQLLDELGNFKALGFPILVGPSRKSFIGYTLDMPVEERLAGTAAAVVIAIDRGADIVRVHDVKEIIQTTRMTDAIVRR